ncbi:MAG TPA: UPF0179 family protein [Candidatus Thermoplasmatota archaeon]|nr:UPF0179 family protein [Candidatus Thermoplasmatota archaeon]
MALTVLGANLAKPGLVFRYQGETDPGCAACKLYKVCHTKELKKDRDHVVTHVRPVMHDVCHVFEGKVQVVEVDPKPLPVRVTIPASATRGTGVSKHWVECGASCLLKQYCNPAALAQGVTAQLEKVEGDVDCLVGRKLKFAIVRPG